MPKYDMLTSAAIRKYQLLGRLESQTERVREELNRHVAALTPEQMEQYVEATSNAR